VTLRPWHLLLVLAALVVPLQAGALGGGSAGASLQVSATLDYCGVGANGVNCKIDVSWTGPPEAESYTATATLADGSVVDMGTVGGAGAGGSTSIWVPYTGNGIYTVSVSAWGADSEGKAEKIGDAKAKVKGQAETEKPPAEKKPPKAEAEKPHTTAPGTEPAPPPASGEAEPPAEPEPATGSPDPDPVPEPVPAPAPEPDPEPGGPAPDQTPAAPAGGVGTPTGS
jgi:hypothetical protein